MLTLLSEQKIVEKMRSERKRPESVMNEILADLFDENSYTCQSDWLRGREDGYK